MVNQRALDEDVRVDRRENLYRLALALQETAHPSGDRTTMPTWAFLQSRLGCSRATVARLLSLLRTWGLLGIVVTGRSGACAPGGALARTKVHHSHVPAHNGTGPINEAAIYVLCQVRHLASVGQEQALEPTGIRPVDTNETPPPEGAKCIPRTPARGDFAPQPEPLRGQSHSGAAQARPEPHPSDYRPGRWYSPTATTSGKDAAIAACRELQARLPVLRRISDRHVRSVLREFFLAGWTVADVILAIDRRPEGHTWAHDGAHGVANVGAWLKHRLTPWRTSTGTVRRSPSQRAAATHVETQARARARREADARHREAIAAEPQHHDTRQQVMAWVRANRGRWAEAPYPDVGGPVLNDPRSGATNPDGSQPTTDHQSTPPAQR